MRLKLNNILKIKNADIEFGGLTVLTGENNTGKSTVGKVLFTLLKAVNNVRHLDRIKSVSLIRKELLAVERMFSNNPQISLLLKDIQDLSVGLTDGSIPIESFLNDIENAVDTEETPIRKLTMLRNSLTRIKKYTDILDNPENAVRSEFESISKSEFMEPINSYGTNHSVIHFQDDTTDSDGSDILINIRDGKVAGIQSVGNTSIEDITYIESPVFLQILNILRITSPIVTDSLRGIENSLGKENIPFHLADMAEKILSPSEYTGLFADILEEDLRQLLERINEIIGGEFVMDGKTKQLSFHLQGHSVPPVSVASGIKSFGMLQRLIQTANLSAYKMLVWDEPEIHLHPEWQISLCEMIVELVANGIPVIVSSHSPYFVQGLRYFAAAKGLEKDVRYYMAEASSESGMATVKEVTEDLNSVFTLLAAPLRKIMNVDEVRNTQK
ncbi:MAG: AAA family ATPase [Muribaculaceae bacterium]|nr:AAA family ATPase [Muribaculaceae bacterium]